MKRKIIVLISSLFLVIPFITPVYADEITTYWDGSYVGYNPALNSLGQEVCYGGKRWRSNYKPTQTLYFYKQANTPQIIYSMFWYIGQYSQLSDAQSDATVFREQLRVYEDTVANNATIYTTSLKKGNTSSFVGKSVQVGSSYRYYVQFTFSANVAKTSPLNSLYTGNSAVFTNLQFGVNLYADTLAGKASNILMGYAVDGTDDIIQLNMAQKETYLIQFDLNRGFINENVVNAFVDGNIIEPGQGIGTGSNGNDSTGVGNGIPSGNGTVGGSSITFDGSDNQVQNQSQYQSQSIESNAVNVTVNNEISGGSGGGSSESDVDRINALDNLLSNQSVGTSFNEAIQNVNNFRQLGVAFADTATVFLGWLPSWVLALLGLMFTLLFFFIILRLLKVFHG